MRLTQYVKEIQVPLFVFIVFLLTTIIFGQTIFFKYVYDDFSFLVGNRAVRGGVTNPVDFFQYPRLAWVGSNLHVYRPLSALFYSIEFKWFAFDPAYYHLVSIIIHAINTLLASCLLYLLLRNKVIAIISSLLFLVHPVNVEAIAWISQQGTLLASTFLFLSLILLVLYHEYGLKWFLRLSLLFALVIPFIKEQLIVTPFLILGIMIFLKFPWQRNIKISIVYFVTMAPYLFMRHFVGVPLDQSGGWFDNKKEAVLTMIHGLAYYIRLIFAPHPLTVNYEWFKVEKFISTTVLLSVASIIFCIFVAIYFYKKAPGVTLGIYWFFAGLIPVNNVVTPIYTFINERFLYISSLGMIFAMICLGYYYLKKIPIGQFKKHLIGSAIFFVLFLILSHMTYLRLPNWKDQKSLLASTFRVDYYNLRNFTNYARALEMEENYMESFVLLRQAQNITGLPRGNYIDLYAQIIGSTLRFNDTRRARIYLTIGRSRYPESVTLKMLEAKYYFSVGNYKKTEEISKSITDKFDLVKAQKEPAFYDAPLYYLIAKKMQGDTVGAKKLIDQAGEEFLQQRLDHITGARVFMLQGRYDEALALLYPVLHEKEISWMEPYIWLADLYKKQGNNVQALATYQVALYKSPTNPDAVLGFERVMRDLNKDKVK
ncbi:MAG: tetratricopeptide repeat protein [Patescibacteria group bacterium]